MFLIQTIFFSFVAGFWRELQPIGIGMTHIAGKMDRELGEKAVGPDMRLVEKSPVS